MVAKALGVALQRCREAPPPPVSELPEEDEGVWEYKRPEPAPEVPPPAAAPAVMWPPLVIEKRQIVEKTVIQQVPAQPAPPKPAALPCYAERSSVSGLPVDNSRILTTDRYVSGILETSINSQLAGEDGDDRDVVIQVNRDVFGYHGRSILIPKGSRLVCGFRAPKAGETRLGLSCGRVLLGGSRAEIYQAAAGGFDVQGRRGVSGEVDNRFWEKYGTAFVLAGISAAVRGASAAIPDEEGEDIAGEGAEELGERFGEITAAVLEETVNLAPIVSLPQGTRLVLRPGSDGHIRRPGDPMPPLAEKGEGNAEG